MADGTRWWIRMLKHTFSIFAGIVLLFALIFNACFVLKYANSDLGSALHALYQVASETSALYTLVAAFITRQKIIDVFDKYQKIFNLSKYFGFSFRKFYFSISFQQTRPKIRTGISNVRIPKMKESLDTH